MDAQNRWPFKVREIAQAGITSNGVKSYREVRGERVLEVWLGERAAELWVVLVSSGASAAQPWSLLAGLQRGGKGGSVLGTAIPRNLGPRFPGGPNTTVGSPRA